MRLSVGLASGESLKRMVSLLEKEIRSTKFNIQEVLHGWFETGGDHMAEMEGVFWELNGCYLTPLCGNFLSKNKNQI